MALGWRHAPGHAAGSLEGVPDCPETVRSWSHKRTLWRHPSVSGPMNITPVRIRIGCSCRPTLIDTNQRRR